MIFLYPLVETPVCPFFCEYKIFNYKNEFLFLSGIFDNGDQVMIQLRCLFNYYKAALLGLFIQKLAQ
jgi:hypothetical protein